MTSQRALAARGNRSQATTRLLIAVRRAERPERSTPEDVAVPLGRGAPVTDPRHGPPRRTNSAKPSPGPPSIEKD